LAPHVIETFELGREFEPGVCVQAHLGKRSNCDLVHAWTSLLKRRSSRPREGLG
jgi:hypothetical protein